MYTNAFFLFTSQSQKSLRLCREREREQFYFSFLMTLHEIWTTAAEGRMSPKEQCKLWALRQVLRKQGEDDTQYEWMASQVMLARGSQRKKKVARHPGREAVRQFFERVDAAGDDWYPGYSAGQRGRKTEMTPGKRRAIATSMMAAKKRGTLPCYETAVTLAPNATWNETTNAPFSRYTINDVLTTDCYDEDPNKPWTWRFGTKRRALTGTDRGLRVEWAKRLKKEGFSESWFRDNVIWVDICSKVIPGSPQKALDQNQAAMNKKKRLMSVGSTQSSENLGGSSTAEKQCGFGDTRVFFFVALTRGVFGLKVFSTPGQFPGETPDGARILVNHLEPLLNKMLGTDAKKPRTLFSDRGPGFYHRKWGTITGDYEAACRTCGFKPWAGTNAKKGDRAQPPDIGDVLLHETTVSWLRSEEAKSRPREPWKETPVQLEKRLQQAARKINKSYDVRGLCMEFPQRLESLIKKTKSDRLSK